MKIGDKVRVKESVIVYHYPKKRQQPFDVKGMEGEVIDVMTEHQGRPISPNLPVVVKFDKKFKAHFQERELETV